jgi:hypothetical protein
MASLVLQSADLTLNASYANPPGSAVRSVGASGRLRAVHVEYASSTSFRFNDPWVQAGIAWNTGLEAPAKQFLLEGYMFAAGGNPAWDGDLPVEQGKDYIFMDFLSAFSEVVKLCWSIQI